MKLEQQVVSLELAKRLKELGVKQESYFCYALKEANEYGQSLEIDNPPLAHKTGNWDTDTFVSAFTVAELGEMCPTYMQTYKAKDYPEWYCSTLSTRGGEHQLEANTEADARAKMLIYLIENGLMGEKHD